MIQAPEEDMRDRFGRWMDVSVDARPPLKGRPGKPILVLGSANLAQTLIGHQLVDEYQLSTSTSSDFPRS